MSILYFQADIHSIYIFVALNKKEARKKMELAKLALFAIFQDKINLTDIRF